MNSNFFFSLKVRELIDKNFEHLYEIDNSNKDILSVILRQTPNLSNQYDDTKCRMLKIIIDEGVILSKLNSKPFIESSTLLFDIVQHHFECQFDKPFNKQLYEDYLSLAKHAIGRGLDLNHQHKTYNNDTTLMLLAEQRPLNFDNYYEDNSYRIINYDLAYSIIHFGTIARQINVDLQNNHGETILTHLAKFGGYNDTVFKLFQRLFEQCTNWNVLYKSDIHFKAILATTYGGGIDWDRASDDSNDMMKCCRIVQLLYNRFPHLNKNIEDKIKELSDAVDEDNRIYPQHLRGINGPRGVVGWSYFRYLNQVLLRPKPRYAISDMTSRAILFGILSNIYERAEMAYGLLLRYRAKYHQFKRSIYS